MFERHQLVWDLPEHDAVVAAFLENVPTTENICKEIFERLKHFPKAKLERVRVEETGNNTFEYAGEEL